MGSCFEFKGTNLLVSDSYFSSNSGYFGGAIFIFGDENTAANCLFERSIFTKNLADFGGSFGFSIRLHYLNIIVTNCYFFENLATGLD